MTSFLTGVNWNFGVAFSCMQLVAGIVGYFVICALAIVLHRVKAVYILDPFIGQAVGQLILKEVRIISVNC